jgi:hypothetical protein
MALSISGGSVTKEALARTMKKDGVGGVIGKVVADKKHLKSGELAKAGNFRVDAQNPASGKANLQVQVNGIKGEKSSIGGALIPEDLYNKMGNTAASGPAGASAKARHVELTKAIQGALTRSVGTWKIVEGKPDHGEYQTFVVGGDFSA